MAASSRTGFVRMSNSPFGTPAVCPLLKWIVVSYPFFRRTDLNDSGINRGRIPRTRMLIIADFLTETIPMLTTWGVVLFCVFIGVYCVYWFVVLSGIDNSPPLLPAETGRADRERSCSRGIVCQLVKLASGKG